MKDKVHFVDSNGSEPVLPIQPGLIKKQSSTSKSSKVAEYGEISQEDPEMTKALRATHNGLSVAKETEEARS